MSPAVTAIYHLHDGQVSSQREEMKAAHTRIACSYADRPWFSRAQVERWRAAVAWDLYRLSGGVRRAAAVARPTRAPALVHLWIWRLQVRRRSSAVARDGGPSLALLPGGARRSTARLLAHHRPARALAPGRARRARQAAAELRVGGLARGGDRGPRAGVRPIERERP